jgi:arylsulfatase A-like enzyme
MLCAPARASLLTGRHDCHSDRFEITAAGIYKKIGTGELSHARVEALINERLNPVQENRVFLGQMAKEAGYVTAQYGKLEWGFASTQAQMKRHGWDHYFGYLDHQRAHGFYPPYLFGKDGLTEIEGNTRSDCGKTSEPETEANLRERWDTEGKVVYSQEIFMDSVLSFIGDHRDQPFFLYFPTQLPHGPVAVPEVHPDFLNHSSLSQIEKEYASMVKMLDDHVGKIILELQKLGIDDKTMVIFTSDNGHEIYYAQEGRIHKPYSNLETGELFDNLERKYYSKAAGDVFDGNGGRAGLKRSNLEGGLQVPLIIRWPARIPPGSISQRLVTAYDFLSTLAEVTGNQGNFASDGLSFYGELIGEKPGNEHEFIVFSSFYGPALISREGWKLRTYLEQEVFELYYLPDDFREETDLAGEYPEKLSELKQKLLEACDGDLMNGYFSNAGRLIRIIP